MRRTTVPIVVAACCFACSAAPDESVAELADAGADTSPPGLAADVATNVDVVPVTDAPCAKAQWEAKRSPVDVILIVDQSGSMAGEIAKVRANINKLADHLKSMGLDYRVVVGARSDAGSLAVCVPKPLGSGDCKSNPPLLRISEVSTGGKAMLVTILTSYDSTDPKVRWSDFVRPDAFKAIIPVTDFYPTAPTPAPIWKAFDEQLLAKGAKTKPTDPVFGTKDARRYAFFPICGSVPGSPSKVCSSSIDGPCGALLDLAVETKGKQFALCDSDYAPVFKAIGEALSERVQCELTLPDPPPGETLDPSKVNVSYSLGSGAPVPIDKDATKPCETAEGWQYSADGKHILLCGSVCAKVKGDTTAKVSIEYGCGTRIKPPA